MPKNEKTPKAQVGRGVGGGPKTDQGKKNTRGNATKHGLCGSRAVVLPDEDQSERDEVVRGWREEYQPDGYAEERLVTELIDSDWALIRAKRRVAWAEEQAAKDWTEESKHHLELMHRYKTAAERSFHRAFNAVQGLRKDRRTVQKVEDAIRELERKIEKLEKRYEPAAQSFDVTTRNPYGPFGPQAADGKNAVQMQTAARPAPYPAGFDRR